VGLTDPIASRLRLDERGRTGHEKVRPGDWMVARYAAPGVLDSPVEGFPQAAAARDALACPPLASLLGAVTEPLGWGRFFRSLVRSAQLTRLRIPAQPVQARAEVCGSGS
jgi:arabinofuranosyltransferase